MEVETAWNISDNEQALDAIDEKAGPVQSLKMHIPKKYLLRDIGDGVHEQIIAYLIGKHK